MSKELNTDIFWLNGFEGNVKGSIFFRSFDLNKFIQKVEESDNYGQVVGLKFKGNDIEIYFEKLNQNKDEK